MSVIFDLDGVLVGSTFFSDILMKMLVQKFEENEIDIKVPFLFQEILRRFVKKLGAENKAIAYDWDLLIQEYLGEYDIHWACEIEDFFCGDDLLDYTYLYKDVDVLDWLAATDYHMSILTNGLPKYQEQVIERLGLKKYFKRVIMPNPDTVKIVKPYREIFELAKDGQPEPHHMIGDSLYFDIYGGNQAGCKTIWIHRRLPKKYKKLPIQARTEKINQNGKFLLKYIQRGAPFLKLSSDHNELSDYKPTHIIYTLQELKELF